MRSQGPDAYCVRIGPTVSTLTEKPSTVFGMRSRCRISEALTVGVREIDMDHMLNVLDGKDGSSIYVEEQCRWRVGVSD